MRPGILLALVALVTSAAGCKQIQERLAQKADENTVESASTGKVDPHGGEGSVTMTGDNGAVIAVGGDNAKIPDSWPKNVPPYPTGTLKGAISATGPASAGKIQHTLTYETPDDAAKVVQFYTDNLKGFTKSNELDLAGNKIVSFEGDGKVVALTISRAPKATSSMLNVMVTNKT